MLAFTITPPQGSSSAPAAGAGSGQFTITPPTGNAGSSPSYIAPISTGSVADKAEASASGATFPANASKETMISAPSKAVGNIPSSAVNFGKNIASMFNPVNLYNNLKGIVSGLSSTATNFGGGKQSVSSIDKTMTTLAGNLPSAAYNVVVPSAARNMLTALTGFTFDVGGAPTISNDPKVKETARKAALDAIVDDPVGQIAPFLMAAKSIADEAGVGDQFDSAVSKVTSPVKTAAGAVAKVGTEAGAQALGVTSGAGVGSIKAAFEGSPEFTSAMRGNTTPEDVVSKAQDAFQKVVDNRRQTYLENFKNLDQYKKSADISTLPTKLSTQLDNFGVKVADDGSLDFSRSSIANNSAARGDIQGVYDTLKDWGSKPGDRTVQGLDTLKKQLGDFYSQSSQARAFVTSIKSSVSDILNKNYPDYGKMTKEYSDASNMLNDIKSATSLGGKAGYDTVFTKLTRALKSDTGFKSEMLDSLQTESGKSLKDYIAGTTLSGYTPKGVGGLVDAGAAYTFMRGIFNASEIPVLLSTSPRVVGEFVKALGVTANGVGKVMSAINSLSTPAGAAAISAAAGTANQNAAAATAKKLAAAAQSFQITPPQTQDQSTSFIAPMQTQ